VCNVPGLAKHPFSTFIAKMLQLGNKPIPSLIVGNEAQHMQQFHYFLNVAFDWSW